MAHKNQDAGDNVTLHINDSNIKLIQLP